MVQAEQETLSTTDFTSAAVGEMRLIQMINYNLSKEENFRVAYLADPPQDSCKSCSKRLAMCIQAYEEGNERQLLPTWTAPK